MLLTNTCPCVLVSFRFEYLEACQRREQKDTTFQCEGSLYILRKASVAGPILAFAIVSGHIHLFTSKARCERSQHRLCRPSAWTRLFVSEGQAKKDWLDESLGIQLVWPGVQGTKRRPWCGLDSPFGQQLASKPMGPVSRPQNMGNNELLQSHYMADATN